MSVVVETTLGDITVDLYLKKRPRACLNFLKLCKIKYYNYNLFHTVSRGFITQTGDPTGSRTGGESIFGVLEGPLKRYFEAETNPRIKHTTMGLMSFVGNEENMIGSQFFFTLGNDLTYLDEKHCVFGEVVEGLDVLEIINEAICDTTDRPYQDIRITHTVILDDPLPDMESLCVPPRSPSPSAERLQGGRIAPDEEIDETVGKTLAQVHEMTADREAKARATILEMVGDIPDADMAPPENVLFVCKLNPVTSDDDLEIIFSRFGKVKSCEVIRDKKTGDSLQYAFVEFYDQKACEDAYFKMDNVLIDDRRIHVDFSQSVSKVKWLGKGRGVKQYGAISKDLGSGKYTRDDSSRNNKEYKGRDRRKNAERSRSRSSEYKRRKQHSDRKQLEESRDRHTKKYDDRHNEDRSKYIEAYRKRDEKDLYKYDRENPKNYRRNKPSLQTHGKRDEGHSYKYDRVDRKNDRRDKVSPEPQPKREDTYSGKHDRKDKSNDRRDKLSPQIYRKRDENYSGKYDKEDRSNARQSSPYHRKRDEKQSGKYDREDKKNKRRDKLSPQTYSRGDKRHLDEYDRSRERNRSSSTDSVRERKQRKLNKDKKSKKRKEESSDSESEKKSKKRNKMKRSSSEDSSSSSSS